MQGETDVRCNELVVFYDDEKDKSGAKKGAAAGRRRGQQQIRRMEARGKVVVTQKDQRAVGDRAEFDMRTNTVTLIGNVDRDNGDNVVRGNAHGGRFDHRRRAHGNRRRHPGRGHLQVESAAQKPTGKQIDPRVSQARRPRRIAGQAEPAVASRRVGPQTA